MSMIFGLSWRHPAVMFFFAIIIIGGGIYIEGIVPIGTPGSSVRRWILRFPLSMIGLFVWARILLHMIVFPEEYLPKKSLALDADVYVRRERFIRGVGYALGFSTLLYSIYQILSLASAL